MISRTDNSSEGQILRTLRRHGLSVTQTRRRILRLFLEQSGALAHGDIEKRIGGGIDRVTLYRNLQRFTEKGIIHAIPTPDNAIRYALCREECEEGHHHDHHIHFFCTCCRKTYCLDDVVTPDIRMPRGYRTEQVEVLVQGVCRSCSA